MDWVPAISRWIHFLAGVMWIGLLYYFNFVNAQAAKAAAADGTGAGIGKHVMPRALFLTPNARSTSNSTGKPCVSQPAHKFM